MFRYTWNYSSLFCLTAIVSHLHRAVIAMPAPFLRSPYGDMLLKVRLGAVGNAIADADGQQNSCPAGSGEASRNSAVPPCPEKALLGSGQASPCHSVRTLIESNYLTVSRDNLYNYT